MKKQTKKILLPILALAVVSVSALASAKLTTQTASASSASVEIGTGANANILTIGSFEMMDGASVRIGDGSEEQTGIRFTGELSVSDYTELTKRFSAEENDVIEAGTLIMPYSYVKFGRLTYENVFSETPKYYWGDKDVSKEESGLKRIQNVGNANISKVTETETVDGEEVTKEYYAIRGSITKYKNENLDRELVAVSYIKATDAAEGKTYYAFANTDYEKNKRSIISVSQNGLIEQGQDGKDANTFNDYIDRYVDYYQDNNGGENPKFNYTEEIYLYKSKGFELYDSTIKTADYISGNVSVGEVPVRDDWNYLIGQNYDGQGQETDILRPDNSAKVKYYFEEARDNVLFSCDGLEGTDDTAFDAFMSKNNVKATNAFGSSTSNKFTKLSATSLHRSDVGIRGVFMAGDLFRITFKEAIKLPTPTKTFSFIGASTVAGAVSVSVGGKSGLVQFDADPTLAPKKYTVTLGAEITEISEIFFATYGVEGEPLYQYNSKLSNKPYYIDNFCWESELYNTASSVKNIIVKKGETSVTIPMKLQSTVYTQEEMKTITDKITATYTCMPSGTETKMELGKDGYIIPVEEERNYKYSVQNTELDISMDGFVLGYFENVFATFEQEEGADGHKYINGMDATKYPNTLDTVFSGGQSTSYAHSDHPSGTPGCNSRIIDEVGSVDGSYTLRGRTHEKWLGVSYATTASAAIKSEGVSYGLNTTKACTTVCFFVYSATVSDVSVKVQYIGHTAEDLSSRTAKEVVVTLSNGWNYIELDFESPVYSMFSFLLMTTNGDNGFRYLDHITLR